MARGKKNNSQERALGMDIVLVYLVSKVDANSAAIQPSSFIMTHFNIGVERISKIACPRHKGTARVKNRVSKMGA